MFPYPNGPFGNMMPYSDFHGMNLDWVIQIAKNFLDQYTHIQDLIDAGISDIGDATESGKQDISAELQEALNNLDAWYTEHREFLETYLQEAITAFGVAADAKAAETIATIPEDYTTLANAVTALLNAAAKFRDIDEETDLNNLYVPGWYILNSATTYTNTPEGTSTQGQRIVFIYGDSDSMTSNHFRHMVYFNYTNRVSGHRVYAQGSWSAWKTDFTFNGITLATGDDLNNLTESGWWTIGSTAVVDHAPETSTGQRMVITYPSATTTSIKHQLYLNYANGNYYHRIYVSGSWNAWISLNVGAMKFNRTLTDNEDLNDLYENGWYNSGYAHNYTHSPEPDGTIGQRMITIRANTTKPTASTWRIMTYYNMLTGVGAHRIYVSGAWLNWIYDKDRFGNTLIESFTPASNDSQGENSGINLRVMTYNLSRYNNDTATYIPDDRIINLRKMLGRINPDIIGSQEDTEYIDLNETNKSDNFIYYPVFPNNYNGDGTYINCIRSKKAATASGRVNYTEGANAYRSIQYALYESGDIKLLAVSTHANWNDIHDGADSADNIARRLSHYTDLFSWINGDITLSDYNTSEAVTVPTWTHCVIMMDANSLTSTDKTNLKTLANSHNMILGNGGALGWFTTEGTITGANSLDNIIVSNNVIINNIESLTAEILNLYSQHAPVYADITLI